MTENVDGVKLHVEISDTAVDYGSGAAEEGRDGDSLGIIYFTVSHPLLRHGPVHFSANILPEDETVFRNTTLCFDKLDVVGGSVLRVSAETDIASDKVVKITASAVKLSLIHI